MNPNNTLTREQIQDKYIEWDLNQMTVDDLKQFFINTQQAELDDLDDIELVKEVKHYAPQLIENITLKVAWPWPKWSLDYQYKYPVLCHFSIKKGLINVY